MNKNSLLNLVKFYADRGYKMVEFARIYNRLKMIGHMYDLKI